MLTKDEIINAAKLADKKSDKPLSQSDFIRKTGIREWQIENLFTEGGWSELKRVAKIKSQPKQSKKQSGKKAVAKGKSISKGKAPAKDKTIAKEDVITEIDGLEITDTKSSKEVVQPPDNATAPSKKGKEERIKVEIAEFGELIDFRGLRHAPVNENGVIYLFGIVSHELGFMVEAVHAAFPDCEAKRHIGENRYQRVRIKFEYKSSNFSSHGYDPVGADMIVCWIHDWDDCPLEVLELKSTIEKLES